MRRDRAADAADPVPSPGYCSRCHQQVPDAVLVSVVERGSGPPAGIAACIACAREMAHTAPQLIDPELARALRRRP